LRSTARSSPLARASSSARPLLCVGRGQCSARRSEYLEKLCDVLFDDLRPRILHEARLPALCEVCTVLQALMVLDATPAFAHASDSDSDSEKGSEEEEEEGVEEGLRRLQSARLLQPVLQDAQTRLFFKAQAHVQADVRHYVPSPEDLAYPARLLGGRPLPFSPSRRDWLIPRQTPRRTAG
jgi:hypothetical protein